MSAAEQLLDERLESISLVDLLLEEQQDLSAVERFSQRHDEVLRPLQERYYRDLIPAAPPGPGEQYAFRVDLDACTGCKACVTACHNLNGLAPEETWREVGLLVGEGEAGAVQQTVTTACHHCEDPACLAGCPVRAYEKDPVTGIVRHLDDQCIGCQYCVLKCPYDVPKYDASRGIVRKCDMCSERLAEGEAPACVQGCPNEAISIERVRVGAVPPALLPARPGTVPDSAYTRPTTRYVRGGEAGGTSETGGKWRGAAELRPVDQTRVRPGDPHHPLSAMLVLSQLAVGTYLLDAMLGWLALPGSSLRLLLGLAAAGLGLAVANLHLGRPRYAFRAILGLRTSWMSREIVALGAFAAAAGGTTAVALLPGWIPALAELLPTAADLAPDGAPRLTLSAATAGMGLVAVLCSAMIYADTRRAGWRLRRSAPLFFGTTLGLGLGAGALSVATAGGPPLAVALLALAWAACGAAKLAFERRLLEPVDALEAASLARSRILLAGALRRALRGRRAAGWTAAVALPFALVVCALAGLPGPVLAAMAGVGLALATIAEWLERDLFFRSCAPVAMPGRG